MAQYAIKGTGFQSVVASLETLRDSGEISPDELEARLTASDLTLLETKINPAGWYGIEIYQRFMKILIEREGGNDPTGYLKRRGSALCERLISAGMYGQLELIERMDDARKRDRVLQDIRLMSTMYESMINFASLSVGEDPKTGIYLEINDADGFPDTLVTIILGFLDSISSRIIADDGHYMSERTSHDCIRLSRTS